MPIPRRALFIIVTLIFSSGVTPIVIRITQGEGMPSLVIVFIRLWLISFALFPIVWIRYREQLFNLTVRQWALSFVAGFWLVMNLFMLFISLEYTSVLVTSVLRRTTPLWIVLPEIVLFGAIFSRRFWGSLLMTIIGVLMIGVGGLTAIEGGTQPLLGAGMASFGAVCFGIYLLIGRKLNNVIPSLLYSFMVFLCSAIVTTVFMLVTDTPVTGYPASGYIWTLIVTVLAQVLGHIFINLGLQIFTATAMAIILQIGVVVSAVIALFTFGEIPSLMQVIGSILVIVGVVVATIEQNQRTQKQKSKTVYAPASGD
jgi:drug/metabolite transporter (DMT)-like permease